MVEQVPRHHEDGQGVEGVALAQRQGILRAELGPDLHPVLGVRSARALARTEDEPLLGIRVGEPAHGIVATAFVSVNWQRPASVASFTKLPWTAYNRSPFDSPTLTVVNRTRPSILRSLTPEPAQSIRQRRSVGTDPATL